MSIRDKIIKLDTIQRRLDASFQHTPLGQVYTERTDEEITKDIKNHKCLYQMVEASGDPMYDFITADYYEWQLRQTKASFTIADGTGSLMRTLDYIAYLKVYGDNDYLEALWSYQDKYNEFCQRWPHLKSALPRPEDVRCGNVPKWVNADRVSIPEHVICSMMEALHTQDIEAYKTELFELWFQWPKYMSCVPSGFEAVQLMDLPHRVEIFVSNLYYNIEQRSMTNHATFYDLIDGALNQLIQPVRTAA